MIPVFRSRMGLWLVRLAVAVPGVLLLGFAVFEFGGCGIGLNRPDSCTHIPAPLGILAFEAGVAGLVLGAVGTPVLLVIGLILEIRARRRGRSG